ncbi:hypothetical protein [Candidatus Methylacidithermus pantelleriae]|uniref:Uncharacterized protein n=1 Tax=Candidatus Methylacidithermus pantelleriae TaxID=2744239 RepID=A0A8J2BPC0_9BACT|nr:hypothetical protein [Candidatus Methylacidithermus pantelleriae]CAF0703831.1 hypothetical protein MPNT_60114 [Candidatus Methylacidithermus pantelleriae]
MARVGKRLKAAHAAHAWLGGNWLSPVFVRQNAGLGRYPAFAGEPPARESSAALFVRRPGRSSLVAEWLAMVLGTVWDGRLAKAELADDASSEVSESFVGGKKRIQSIPLGLPRCTKAKGARSFLASARIEPVIGDTLEARKEK